MKSLLTLLSCLLTFATTAQLINRAYNQSQNNYHFNNEAGIVASGNTLNITCKVVYNAVPDGYLVTFTTTFIGSTIDEVETTMNHKIDQLVKDVKGLDIASKDILIDILALDPIFDVYGSTETVTTSPEPKGYKITQNITFNLKQIDQFRKLSVVCMNHNIYDVISIQAYLDSSTDVYDSLAEKAVEVLEHKKQLAADIGWTFGNGKISFSKQKDVLYPSERYLKSQLKNSSLYKHHLSQNSTIDVSRRLEVNNYYTLDLKDADFVFNASETNPVIQFYYQINYSFITRDTEAELREKIRKEVEKEHQKTFYLLDKKGKLKAIDLD